MDMTNAAESGRFRIGGAFDVNRLGFGAMRVVGRGIWGPPPDRAEALRTLRRLPDLGVDFIDTADSYGPDFSEELIREALAPYGKIHVATKGGLARTGPNIWIPLGRPEYLIQQAYKSRWRLGVETIDLWQLHRIDAKVPANEQFDAIKSLIEDGVIRCAGLSEVSVAEIEAASKVFPVATVQNRYNLTDRASEAALDHCTKKGIGFIPWFPLNAGELAHEGSALDAIAAKHKASPGQIALAWLLKRSPVMLPIPGTGKVAHLEENVGAAAIKLTDDEFVTLDRAGRVAS
ncbi:MAG TPA: aldo/keto reductase [Roseiarcus sp.]|nr:aldo/keto reductase [Roseiarcus sp.]